MLSSPPRPRARLLRVALAQRARHVRSSKSGTGPSPVPKRGRWSKAEQARLRELYGLKDEAVIARELRRSVASVLRSAKVLFSRQARRSGPWTASETLELKHYLGASTPEVIARILGRSVAEVEARIFDLGRIRQVGTWTREETVRFKRIHGTRTDEDLSRIFARSETEIRRLAQEHGLSKDKAFVRRLRGEPSTRMPRWKPEELHILREGYPIHSNVELARQLKRSVKSVVSKAHNLRLKKSSDRLREMGRENVSARYKST